MGSEVKSKTSKSQDTFHNFLARKWLRLASQIHRTQRVPWRSPRACQRSRTNLFNLRTTFLRWRSGQSAPGSTPSLVADTCLLGGAWCSSGRRTETPTSPIRTADRFITSFHALGTYSAIIHASYQDMVKKFQVLLTCLWQRMLRKGWRR